MGSCGEQLEINVSVGPTRVTVCSCFEHYRKYSVHIFFHWRYLSKCKNKGGQRTLIELNACRSWYVYNVDIVQWHAYLHSMSLYSNHTTPLTQRGVTTKAKLLLNLLKVTVDNSVHPIKLQKLSFQKHVFG